eukprot:GEMP01030588.1.p1 GENE.GEMP01030588.1~~GEMP01030588.1.p1  ORF type:complete len:295 (+),score=72.95 GEMP01030588.1:46-930(+)
MVRRLGPRPKPTDFNAPQQPPSGYFAFSNIIRDKTVADLKAECAANGTPFKITEVGLKLAEQWKVYPDEKKAELNVIYVKEKEKYKVDLEEWKKTEDFKKYLQAKLQFDSKKDTAAARKDMFAAGAPKKVTSAYFLFATEHRNKLLAQWRAVGKKADVKELGQLCGDAWRELPAESRQPYNERFQLAKVDYAEKQAEFEKTEAYQRYETAKNKVSKKTNKVKNIINQVGKDPSNELEEEETPKEKKEKKPRKPRAKKSSSATDDAAPDAPEVSDTPVTPVVPPADVDVPMATNE